MTFRKRPRFEGYLEDTYEEFITRVESWFEDTANKLKTHLYVHDKLRNQPTPLEILKQLLEAIK